MNEIASVAVKFLLVDDREANLISMEKLLQRDGLTLLKAHSGAEALELLLKHDVALALVDVQMPDMDGFELAELMRGSERTRRIPIVFVTAASSDPQRRFEGYEKGAVDFLQKPIEGDILKSKASVFFDLYTQRQEVSRQRDEMEQISRENARLLEESQRVANALKEADKRKDEFLATLAHELRNPLSPILSGIQLLGLMARQDEPLEGRQTRDMIERQVHHMVRLVDDLLEVSRITSGKIKLERKAISLKDVVRQAVETSRPNIDAGNHELSIDTGNADYQVYGDNTRLTQVVANLINNASRYTPKGGSITVSLSATDHHASISVTDNGIGIPSAMLEKVFELFTQLKRQCGPSVDGLGIGLALVKRIVELHDGFVSVTSEGENRGATFVITLPLIHTSSLTDLVDAASFTQPSGHRRILAIDDNNDAVMTLKGLLTAMGHEVVTAQNGGEGIELFKSFQPSCVFLDIGMPEMDGCEVARKIRLLPGGDLAQLFALTGWGQDQDRVRTNAAGFDFHIVKPVSKSVLQGLLCSTDSATL